MYEEEDSLSDNMREKTRLLPAWFCKRMVAKDGTYVFVLNGGVPVGVRRITGIHQDTHGLIWLDVELLTQAEAEILVGAVGGICVPIGAVGTQRQATLSSACVMMAYEINVPTSGEAA